MVATKEHKSKRKHVIVYDQFLLPYAWINHFGARPGCFVVYSTMLLLTFFPIGFLTFDNRGLRGFRCVNLFLPSR